MSIGKRLFNLARSELNSLLDSAVAAEQERERRGEVEDSDEDLYHRFSLDQLSDAELEAEIERRERARQARKRSARAQAGGKPTSTSTSSSAASGARASSGGQGRGPWVDHELRQAYAALEVPFGADLATVRKSYRALMRRYHPDRHAGSPDKQKAATELAQKLSAAYELIQRGSRPGRGPRPDPHTT